MTPGTLIVGASLGGVRVAQSLRSLGYEAPITIVGTESDLPYDRPHLSKRFLDADTTDAIPLADQEDLVQQDIQLVLGTAAAALDTASQEVQTSIGTKFVYDHLVVATGCRARSAPWESSRLHVLRDLQDAHRVKNAIAGSTSVGVIGAGFIGSEVAAAAATSGRQTHLVDVAQWPMSRALDEVTGGWFTQLHRKHGVELHLGTGVSALHDEGDEVVVTLQNGEQLRVGTVVAGLGAIPNTEWLEGSGVPVSNGVTTDEYCLVRGHENVWALGDVANWYSVRSASQNRLEHWTNAVEQASTVAHNILNPTEMRTHDAIPYVWTDQYGWKCQLLGGSRGSRRVIVGDPIMNGKGAALYGDADGQLSGVVTVNLPILQIRARQTMSVSGTLDDLVEFARTRRLLPE